jgi:hypothetical protein
MAELPDLALSVRQPWAWAIIHAGKRLENRSAHAIRMGGMKPGRICIHASKGMTQDEYESGAESISFNSIGKAVCPRPDALIRGGIIGVVTVTGKINESRDRWFCGPWALVLEGPEACEPIPCVGELGYFKWRDNVGYQNAKHPVLHPVELEAPKPWMLIWPNRPARLPLEKSRPTAPLFDQSPASLSEKGETDG